MVLHSQRKRRAERDLRESLGEELWTEELPSGARIALSTVWSAIEEADRYSTIPKAVSHRLRIGGVAAPTSVNADSILEAADSDLALDLLGAFAMTISESVKFGYEYPKLETFINEVLEDYRVAFRVIDAEVVPIESDELHTTVVVPALQLLVGSKFARAHSAYLEALKQLPANPANAITDAGTALQETLAALDCKGNALGPLIKSARSSGLLAAHDERLTDGIEKFLQWASANRSETGDSHKVTNASRDDAWLMIHVVGALIVKLAKANVSGGS